MPVQVLPRKVTQITQPAASVIISSTALCILLAISKEVLCVFDDSVFKINFPIHTFPTSVQRPYHPPTAASRASVIKILSCEGIGNTSSNVATANLGATAESVFAALTAHGDVFSWSPGSGGDTGDHGVKPQRVWSLRRQMSAVTVSE